MARLIGVVKTVVGEVFTVAADGSKRQLAEGDRVFAGERLLTGADGAVAIRLANGEELTVGRDSTLMLDSQLLAGEGARAQIEPANPDEVPSAFQLTEVEQAQRAISAGIDPTTGLPATAAGAGAGGAGGAGAGGGGISFVLLGETGDRVDPNIGYPTGSLAFSPLSPKEFLVDADELPDPRPSIDIEYFTDSTGQVLAERGFVDEAALPGGSNEESSGEFSYGRLVINSPDGIQAIQVLDVNGNWVDVTAGGTVQGQYGSLVVKPDGTWVFILEDNSLDHDDPNASGTADQVERSIQVRVIDGDGDVSRPASVVFNIADDAPQAINDSVLTPEDTPVTVNVLGNDIQGADGGASLVSAVLTGGSGTVSFSADGSVTFAPAPGFEGLASIRYVMRDADGDTSQAVLTVGVGVDSIPDLAITYGPGEGRVDEEALNAGGIGDGLPGSNPASMAEQTSGSLIVQTGADTVGSVTISSVIIGGVDVTNGGTVAGQYGVLQVTKVSEGEYSWTYTLADNSLDHDGANLTGTDDQVFDVFSVEATDNEGDPAGPQSLTIAINDDGPTAVNDGNSLSEDTTSVGGNVLANDISGADAGMAVTTPGSYAGTYGQLVLNADGSYTYTLYTDPTTQAIIQGLSDGESLSESFGYGMRDGDNDPSSATLTLTIQGADDGVVITGFNQQSNEILVDEDDLPNGTDQSDSLSRSDTFQITAPDGIATINIEGTTFTYAQLANSGNVNLVIDSPAGVLVINGYSGTAIGGTVSFTYTLQAPVNNAPGSDLSFESFTAVVTDVDGSVATGTRNVFIIDDQPIAAPDSNSLSEDATSVGGNVLTNDIAGADGGATVTTPGSYDGTYGQLVLNADGSYTYTLYTDADTQAIIQGLSDGESLSESFGYSMSDADNDPSSASLTLTIQGAEDGVVITGFNQQSNEILVDEDDLPNGTDQSDSLSRSDTFQITAPDGIATINIEGTTFTYAQLANSGNVNLVIDSPAGMLVINGYSGTAIGGTVSFTYTLQAPVNNAPGSDLSFESFTAVVTDVDGSVATGTRNVFIIDDQPIAAPDSNSLSEDATSVGGNVLTNDIAGADGGKVVITPGSYAGTYGQLVLNTDGSYTYTLNADPAAQALLQGLSSGESLSESFGYDMRDGDNDSDSAILTITIQGADDGVIITGLDVNGGELLVDEDDLPNGSDQTPESLSDSGSFAIVAPDGIATVSIGGITFSFAQLANSGSVNLVIDSPAGVLVINGYSGTAASGTVSYTYTLQAPVSNAVGANQASESFAVIVTDEDGSFSTSSLDVTIIDDVPTANPDTNSVAEGGVIGGNVLTDGADDVFGADGATAGGGVVGVKVGGDTATPASGGVGALLVGTYGTLVLSADGSYTYDGFPNVVPPAGATDVFTYTIRDADGDLSTTTLTIGLTDSGVFAPLDNDVLVYENALDTTITGSDIAAGTVTGSLASSPAETDASNQLAATGGVGTLTYSLVGSATGTYGTIQINSDGTYVYTLTKPYDTSPDADNGANVEQDKDSFTYQVTDANGNTATGTIVVDIVDDVPLAFQPVRALLVDQTTASHTVTVDLRFAESAGADGVGNVVFNLSQQGLAATDANGENLLLNGEQLYLYYGTDQTQLVAKTAVDGDIGYTIDIDPAGDSYTLTTFGIISISVKEITTTDLGGVGAGNVNFKGLIDIGGTEEDVLISSTTGSINSDLDDIGIGSQWISTGENVRFDFVNSLAMGGSNGTGFTYSDHNLIFSFRQLVYVQGGPTNLANLIVTAIIANSDYVFGNSDAGETQVNLSEADIKVFDGTTDVTDQVSLVDTGNSITIVGMQDGWTFQVTSDTGYSAVHVEGAADTDEFSLGFFSYSRELPSQPIDLTHAITATDGDGDTITSSLDATLYPEDQSQVGDGNANMLTGTGSTDYLFGNGGADQLYGLLGDDVLVGGDGNDLLVGGMGNDLLAGGSGADTFKWQLGDTGTDRITDFKPGVDVLDLSDLLTGLSQTPDATELTSYLSFTFGTSTTITVDANGSDATVVPPQSIVLEGVDLSVAYNSPDAAGVITGMLGDSTLKVDNV